MDNKLLAQAISLWQSANNAVALTGAGVSTSSGIPDFRSGGSGVWENVDPLAVASLSSFRRTPERFFAWFRDLASTIMNAEPNPAHHALARLEQLGQLSAIITQNIDLLHSKAGSKTVYEVHGHLRTATCINCGARQPGEQLMRTYLTTGVTPECKLCGGTLKPDVVLFGENLPSDIYIQAVNAVRQCDLFLVAGSSLSVWPINELPRLAIESGAKIIIVNRDPTECDDLATLVVHDDVASFLPQIAAAF